MWLERLRIKIILLRSSIAKILELNLIVERIIMIFLLNHYLGVKMFSKNMEEELRALISEVVKFHRLQELRV